LTLNGNSGCPRYLLGMVVVLAYLQPSGGVQ
jgi:hypothetical protein